VDSATRWVHRGGVLLIGFATAALEGFLGLIVALLLTYEYEGVFCEQWLRDVTFLGVWGGPIAGPLLGMIWSLNGKPQRDEARPPMSSHRFRATSESDADENADSPR
jgi:hypothetical protein